MQEHKHGFPAFLSFIIPGLGQLIKGQVIKGILIFIACIVSWFILPIILPFLIWIWNVYDAYNSN